MCGKFTQLVRWEEGFELSQVPQGAEVTVSTPMRMAKIMRLGEDGKRERVAMRWGFSKHQSSSPVPDHMHARAETVESKPRFCDAFGERRGILLVETFNEGEELPNGKKQQWVIRPKDNKLIPIAVIWEEWEGENGVVPTFVMITVPPNELIGKITDRMPAVMPQTDWPVWLGEADAKLKDIQSLLKTFDDGGNWEMTKQEPSSKKKSEAAKPPPKPQMDLF